MIPLLLLVLAVLATPAAARTRAIGAPGATPTWTPADKQAFGTSATRDSRVWFTLREREMTEVYFPDLGTPSLRSLEFVVARPGPEMAVDRETAHATGVVERLEGLNFRQTVTGPESRWRLTKTYTTDPFRSTVLVHVRFESLTGEPYRLHVLLDPQLSNDGRDDRSRTISGALVASDRRMASALAASPAFTATSSGYASTSDPWSDLRDDGSLDAEADARQRGNVRQAATMTLDGVQQQEATLALGFGAAQVTARRAAADALTAGFAPLAAENAAGWARHRATLKPAPAAATPVLRRLRDVAADARRPFRQGQPGGRDRVAVDALGVGQDDDVRASITSSGRATSTSSPPPSLPPGRPRPPSARLDFLLQRRRSAAAAFRRIVEVGGRSRSSAYHMDDQALPIVLAWQLQRFDVATWRALRRTAEFIVRHGPRTELDRWGSAGGYSPAAVAAQIAGLVCAADIARRNGAEADAARYERVADRWAGAVERWTATANGPYSDDPYYLRLSEGRRPDRGTRYDVGSAARRPAHDRRRRASSSSCGSGSSGSTTRPCSTRSRSSTPGCAGRPRTARSGTASSSTTTASVETAAVGARGARPSGACGRSSPASAASTSCWPAARPTPT